MRVFQCAVMGTGGVGKSAITVRFINGSYLEWYDPTIEDSYRKQFTVDSQPCLLEILDTAGVEQFISLNDIFIRDSEAFVLVFALNQRDSFEELAKIRENIYRVKSPAYGRVIPMVLVGNKSDLVDDRQVTPDEPRSLAERWKCEYFETSARLNQNITPVFEDVVRQLRTWDALYPPSEVKRKRKLRRECIIL